MEAEVHIDEPEMSPSPVILLDHEQAALERLLLDLRRDLERRLAPVLCLDNRAHAGEVLDDVFAAAVARAVGTLHAYLDGPPTQPAVGRLVA